MVGFRIQDQESLSTKYICPSCSLLLRDPVQLINCAHRVCQSCIDEQKGNVINCPACHDKVSREELKLDRGFRNDMQTLIIKCALCSWTDVLKNYQTHLDQNHSNPICPYCNAKFTSVNDLNAHLQFNCKRITVNCPLKPIGCEEQILRAELCKHYSSERHQRVLINFIRQMQRRNSHPRTSISNTNHLQVVDESINAVSSSAETLSDDFKRLDIELKQNQNALQSIMEGLSTNKKCVDDQDALVNSIRSNQETFEGDIQLAAWKWQEVKMRSFDGFYIWKIDHVHDKMAAAQSGAQISIDSLPFYSSPTGYKMCIRLYLNGDNDVRGTDLSLYFILMRGEFDAILKYPFCFKMIFCLYDQSDRRNHIVRILRPNVTSNDYCRPQSDMTVAGRISKFVSLETLRQKNNSYICEDTMYIKTMIDFSNIAQDIIPYAMNLSPALTSPMQQTMIQEETEKQRRV